MNQVIRFPFKDSSGFILVEFEPYEDTSGDLKFFRFKAISLETFFYNSQDRVTSILISTDLFRQVIEKIKDIEGRMFFSSGDSLPYIAFM